MQHFELIKQLIEKGADEEMVDLVLKSVIFEKSADEGEPEPEEEETVESEEAEDGISTLTAIVDELKAKIDDVTKMVQGQNRDTLSMGSAPQEDSPEKLLESLLYPRIEED